MFSEGMYAASPVVSHAIAVVASLNMPPSQYDNVMRILADLREEMRNLTKALHDHASLEAEDREALEERLDHALLGGNGDGPGIFERLRNIFDWRQEHINSHDHWTVERRSSTQDWRKFWIGVADRTFTVVFAIFGILLIYLITGHVVTFP